MSTASVGSKRRGRIQFLWMTLGVVTGLAALNVGSQFLPHHDPVRLEAWNKVQPHLEETDKATRNEVETSTKDVKQFFAERKRNARAFAADVLSLSGKWAYVTSFFQEGNHERYLEESFEKHIFASDDLKAVIESAVSRYVSEIQGRENQLLVAIRADLEDSGLANPEYLPALANEAEFRREYDSMLEKVMPIVNKEMGVTVTREIVSLVASEIAALVLVKIGASLATELGISGGILGTGAAAGVATFGVGLVAGILVDMALDWAIRQAGYDPEGEIAAKVVESLDRVERLIPGGDKKAHEQYDNASFYSTWSLSSAARQASWAQAQALESGGGLGLTHQLHHINNVRSRLRQETLKSLILTGGAQ